MTLAYRVRQFWQQVRGRPLPAPAWQEIESVLGEGELALFRRFSLGDRQHGYRVLRLLRAAGHEEPHLLAAALLHDIGKTKQRLHLWERVVGALGERFFPGRVAAWGHAEARGWRRPFVMRAQHAAWGAEMARAAGSDCPTVWLIRHHQDSTPAQTQEERHRLLRRLQWADDRR